MAHWLNLGEIFPVNAEKYPNKTCLCDESRSFTYKQTEERTNRLANALLGKGLNKGDKIAVLLENCIEFIEIYVAAAKAGLVVVPVNFRHVAEEVAFIADNADAKAFIVHEEWIEMIEGIKGDLQKIPGSNYICVGGNTQGFVPYEDFLAAAGDRAPGIEVLPKDTWILLYTSGTTGKPKGVVRSHESYIAFYLINGIDFRFDQDEICMNVMPLCHVNSTYFTLNVTYLGGTVYVHPARRFEPVELLDVIEREKITFISLVPTHYHLILNVQDDIRAKYDTSSIRKLLCSSAPARRETKLGIMEFFPGVQLYEGYGSTEAGIVTTLFPNEQLKKLGSIGRESTGTAKIKILDEKKRPVAKGQVGELYSMGPMLFDEYYKMPEKTAGSHAGEYFSAGDMAYEDEDGYYYLVDRKDNMIITGGEKVFPSEVESLITSHEDVFDVACIGLSDAKWGEIVTAVVIPRKGRELKEQDLIDFCKDKIAGFKRPKKVIFISQDDMPRTATGKILHRKLKERFDK
ncbi:MAG: long-chain fatty acid--CoA ligase [Deltaproteobacteria bacterium]|nr:long-chain fatty acid--CoA ligase [Deltaproteobacteria bacterium]